MSPVRTKPPPLFAHLRTHGAVLFCPESNRLITLILSGKGGRVVECGSLENC